MRTDSYGSLSPIRIVCTLHFLKTQNWPTARIEYCIDTLRFLPWKSWETNKQDKCIAMTVRFRRLHIKVRTHWAGLRHGPAKPLPLHRLICITFWACCYKKCYSKGLAYKKLQQPSRRLSLHTRLKSSVQTHLRSCWNCVSSVNHIAHISFDGSAQLFAFPAALHYAVIIRRGA